MRRYRGDRTRAGALALWACVLLAALSPAAVGAAVPDGGVDIEGGVALEGLEVRADREERTDPVAQTVEVSGERVRESARPSVLEAVAQEAPGVYVTSRGPGIHGVAQGASGAIKIRGLGGSPNTQVLVVVDGVPDYQGIFGHPLPDTYVPELLERVQVLPGGDSVRYGNNALGGVILLESRWRHMDGVELHMTGGWGSWNTLLLQPVVLARWGAWDVVGSAHVKRTDGHREGAGGSLAVGQSAVRYSFDEDNRLTLRLKAAHLEGADPGPATHPTPDHWFDALRVNASLGFDHWSPLGEGRAVLFSSWGRHELHDGFLSDDVLAGGIVEYRWFVHRRVDLLFGMSGDHVDGRVENRLEDSEEPVEGMTHVAGYQEVHGRPFDRWTLMAGARELYSPEHGFLFLYKVGSEVGLWPGASLRARWSTNFRAPTIRERYLPYPVANPDLKPERSGSLDVGLRQDVGRHVRAEVTAFLTDAHDFVKYFGSWPAAEVVNIDHVRFWGLEGQLRLRRLGPFELSLGCTWMDVGRYTAQNPSLKLDGTLRFRWRGFSASLAAEWVSGLYQRNYEREPLDDVFFTDLSLRYGFVGDDGAENVELFLSIRNITDHDYAFIDRYPMPRVNAFGGLEIHL